MEKWAPFPDIRGSHLGVVDMFLEAWLDRVTRGEIDRWISGINRWGCLDCFEGWLLFCGRLEAWGYFGGIAEFYYVIDGKSIVGLFLCGNMKR